MYVIHDTSLNHFVFTEDDPRNDDCSYAVSHDVTLELSADVESLHEMHAWPYGAEAPDVCLGRDPENESRFKVFRYDHDCRDAGFINLGPNFSVHHTWSDYESIAGRKPQ
ncbi:MAG TPA: hypothetical protein PKD64_18660 [Pirellulaceae bacterium]|nr:hypothetical protein [Pirellulaceae bacterium]HMO94213.1 hypothetical protein [Pirellulaceae bacterium]